MALLADFHGVLQPRGVAWTAGAACDPHDADFGPQDRSRSLFEVQRTVQ